MVIGIRLRFRMPHDLFAVNDFSVHNRAYLSVAAAGIESDAASVQMPADGERAYFLFGEGLFVAEDHFEGFFINSFHKSLIESTDPLRRISLCDELVNFLIAADINFISADHPQHGFDKAFRHA